MPRYEVEITVWTTIPLNCINLPSDRDRSRIETRFRERLRKAQDPSLTIIRTERHFLCPGGTVTRIEMLLSFDSDVVIGLAEIEAKTREVLDMEMGWWWAQLTRETVIARRVDQPQLRPPDEGLIELPGAFFQGVVTAVMGGFTLGAVIFIVLGIFGRRG